MATKMVEAGLGRMSRQGSDSSARDQMRRSGQLLFSDMMALQALAGTGTYISEMKVVGVDRTFGIGIRNPNACSQGNKGLKWAAHFSHEVTPLAR